MSTITDLIERLENATGPDRWLDAKIDAAFRVGSTKLRNGNYQWAWDNFPTWAPNKHAKGMCGVRHDSGDLGMIWDSMEFTASIGAAVALAEHILPSGSLEVHYRHSRLYEEMRWSAWVDGRKYADEGVNGAVALTIAVLKAREAIQGDNAREPRA